MGCSIGTPETLSFTERIEVEGKGQTVDRSQKAALPTELSVGDVVISALNAKSAVAVDARQADATILSDLPQARPWDPRRFTLERKLEDASRNQGSVDMMRDAEAGGFVAVKRMPLSWTCESAATFDQTHSESLERPWFDIAIVNFLNKEEFTGACTLLGVFFSDSSLFVVSSMANGGDLFGWSVAVTQQPGPDREAVMRPVVRQLASAVRRLHDHGIAHHDISLENVLIHQKANGTPCVKLIDFGMSTYQRFQVGEVRGKYSYQAPEMHRGNGAYDGFLADVFAVGVALFCIVVMDYPWLSTKPRGCKKFDSASEQGLAPWMARRTIRKSSRTLAEVLSSPLRQLLAGLLDFAPATRLTLGERAWRLDCPSEGTAVRASAWSSEWLGPEDVATADEGSEASTTDGGGMTRVTSPSDC